ncbi:uncharacterized protein LOC106804426 [Setaria italica]|uniref:uncharacterized protein LOC106804426 n=1 Tax=Setaria italica TaxID=4555 RepID=UPI000719A060|nr:uncharacterized protein LOC106804426 [Setaria italica]
MSSADSSMCDDTTTPTTDLVPPPGPPPAADGGSSVPPLGTGGSSGATPIDNHAKLLVHGGAKLQDGFEYRSLDGALQYLTLTRPDLAYAVQQVCLFTHDLREPRMALIKRILRYVKGTLSSGLHIGTGPIQSLTADANWAGCPDSRRSTFGFYVYLGDNLVSWSSKRQTVSRSNAKAEYRAVAHVVAECC